MAPETAAASIDAARARLLRLAGAWKGETRVWLEPGAEPDVSSIEGTLQGLLHDRFLTFTYQGTFGGDALEGMMLVGLHRELAQAELTWVDTFHTGTAQMPCKGPLTDDGFSVLGAYSYVDEHGTVTTWGWRMVWVWNDDALTITMYNVTPEGHEAKGVEMHLQRR